MESDHHQSPNENKQTSSKLKRKKTKKKKTPKLKALSNEEEELAIVIAQSMFEALTTHLRVALRNYKKRKVVDPYKELKNLKQKLSLNGNFLGEERWKNCNTKTVLKALEGRNMLVHVNLYKLHHHWKDYLISWIRLAKLINGSAQAKEMQKILNDIQSR